MRSLIKTDLRLNISASGKMFFFVKYFLASEFKGILFKSLLFLRRRKYGFLYDMVDLVFQYILCDYILW